MNQRIKKDRSLLVFLSLVALQWVKLISFGGGTLKAAHLAFFVPPLMLWAKGKIILPQKSLMALLTLHSLLFAALLLTAPFSTDLSLGLRIIIRMSAYYVFGVLILFWLSTIEFEQLKLTLSRAIFYVSGIFTAVFGYYVAVSGTNILTVFTKAISSGNPNFIQYNLFVTVMNKGRLDGLSPEESIDAAGRHGIMMFLLIILFSRLVLPKIGENGPQLLLGKLLVVMTLLLVFVSLSRVAILILICAGFLFLVHRVLLSKLSMFVHYSITVLALGGLIYLFFGEQGRLGAILYEKLVVDVVNNPRVYEFTQILNEINSNPFIGAGTGSELDLFDLAAKAPHNFILFWWYQSGVIGLFLSALTLTAFIMFCLKFFHRSIQAKNSVISDVWLLSSILFVVPIIRMLVAKQGALALTEWISIAIALTLSSFALKTRATQSAWPTLTPNTLEYSPK